MAAIRTGINQLEKGLSSSFSELDAIGSCGIIFSVVTASLPALERDQAPNRKPQSLALADLCNIRQLIRVITAEGAVQVNFLADYDFPRLIFEGKFVIGMARKSNIVSITLTVTGELEVVVHFLYAFFFCFRGLTPGQSVIDALTICHRRRTHNPFPSKIG